MRSRNRWHGCLPLAWLIVGAVPGVLQAQERAARPGGTVERAARTVPFGVEIFEMAGSPPQPRRYLSATVTVRETGLRGTTLCTRVRIGPKGWPCGSIRTGTTVVVEVVAPNSAANAPPYVVLHCTMNVPGEVGNTVQLTALRRPNAPLACSW